MDTKNKICKNCGFALTTINYTANTVEQWTLNGDAWECVARNTLVDDPEQEVFCPECDSIVGTGKDFGF